MKALVWPEEARTEDLVIKVDREPKPPPKPLNRSSFRAFCNRYLQACCNKGVCGGTTDSYHMSLVQLAIFAKDRHITQDVITQFFAHLEDKGIKPNTLIRHKKSLNSFFRWMVRNGHASENVVKEADLRLPARTYKTDTFSKEEYEKIKKAGAGTWVYPAAVLAYNTGMRMSDTLRATWRWVDFEREEITYSPQKLQKLGRRCIIPFVTGGDLCVMLHEARQLAAGDDDTIVKRRERPFVSKDFTKLLHSIGIYKKSFHTFRRTFISNLLSSGADSYIVMVMAGITSHKTMKHYFVPHIDSLRAAMEKAEAYAKLRP